jgi:hypothetical protein
MTKTDIINIYKWESIRNPMQKERGFWVMCVLIILLSGFVLAGHIITTSGGGTSYNYNEDVTNLYNITVNNNDSVSGANITRVNITLPGSFSILDSSNSSDAAGTLTISGNELSWTNNSFGLIMNLSWKYFAFNATASTPGNYNITVTTTNATGSFSSNISVTINDTTAPLITFVTPANGANLSQNYIIVNITATDDSTVGAIVLIFYNSTYTNTTSSTGTNHYVNITNLGEGVYYYNVTANDSKNYINNSVTRSLRLDRTKPVIYLISPDDDYIYTADNNIDFEYNVTDAGGIKNCSLLIDSDINKTDTDVTVNILQEITSTALEDSVYDWFIRCYDFAGNYNDSEEWEVELDYISDDDSDDGGGGGEYVSSFWTNTYNPTSAQAAAGYNKELKKGERIKVKVGNESHYVGIIKISSNEVTINVSSNPQQAVLEVGETKSFEVTNDSYYDINVTLNKINSTNANISVQSIHEKRIVTTSQVEEQEEESLAAEAGIENETTLTEAAEQKAASLVKNKWFWIILVVALAAIGGAMYYFLVVKKSKIARSVKIRES